MSVFLRFMFFGSKIAHKLKKGVKVISSIVLNIIFNFRGYSVRLKYIIFFLNKKHFLKINCNTLNTKKENLCYDLLKNIKERNE